MARAFTEEEKEHIKQGLMSNGAKLIRQKGLRNVTVDELTQSTGIAKGSFYSFYPSRESLFWDVIKKEEVELLAKIEKVAGEKLLPPDKVKKIFKELFLHEGSLAFHMDDLDRDYLIKKLPRELIEADRKKSGDVLRSLLSLCNLSATQANAEQLMAMLQTLRLAASSQVITNEKRKKSFLILLVDSFAYTLTGGLEE